MGKKIVNKIIEIIILLERCLISSYIYLTIKVYKEIYSNNEKKEITIVTTKLLPLRI